MHDYGRCSTCSVMRREPCTLPGGCDWMARWEGPPPRPTVPPRPWNSVNFTPASLHTCRRHRRFSARRLPPPLPVSRQLMPNVGLRPSSGMGTGLTLQACSGVLPRGHGRNMVCSAVDADMKPGDGFEGVPAQGPPGTCTAPRQRRGAHRPCRSRCSQA